MFIILSFCHYCTKLVVCITGPDGHVVLSCLQTGEPVSLNTSLTRPASTTNNENNRYLKKMNSLFTNPGLQHVVIQIISHLDTRTFLRFREVNKTLLSLIDGELSLWRNAFLKIQPIDLYHISRKDLLCICIQQWKNASKPFMDSLPALQLLVPFMLAVHQKHLSPDFVEKPFGCSDLFDQVCSFGSFNFLELIINHLAVTTNKFLMNERYDLRKLFDPLDNHLAVPRPENRLRNNVFERACNSGRLEAVQLVWKAWREHENARQELKPSILSAWKSPNPQILKFVLHHFQEFDINEIDTNQAGRGRTIIHKVIDEYGGRLQPNVDILLENCQGKGFDWNAQDDDGDTPLIWALKNIKFAKMRKDIDAYHQYVKALKELMRVADSLIDIDLPNRVGDTARKYVTERNTDQEIFKAVKNHIVKMTK